MATRFDDWEGEYLAHFRTKGSKNGVRRYQTESGEWTPLGLRERRAREGWGDGDRQARKAAKAQKRAERKAAKAERIAAFKEQKRKSNMKTMTDEELKAAIERKKMEIEYRELSKSPARQMGEKVLEKYFENKEAREHRLTEKENRNYEMMKMKEQTKQAEIRRDEAQARAKAEEATAAANKARAETDKIDIESGTRMKKLKKEMLEAKGHLTIGGGIKKMINARLGGYGEAKASLSQYKSEAQGVKKAHAKIFHYNNRHKKNSAFQPAAYDPDPWNKRKPRGGGGKGKP